MQSTAPHATIDILQGPMNLLGRFATAHHSITLRKLPGGFVNRWQG